LPDIAARARISTLEEVRNSHSTFIAQSNHTWDVRRVESDASSGLDKLRRELSSPSAVPSPA
jgi:hypothetical protein